MIGETRPHANLGMACLESLSMMLASVEVAAKAMAASSASTAKGVLTVPAVMAGPKGAEEGDTKTVCLCCHERLDECIVQPTSEDVPSLRRSSLR